jgi:TPR repeat protein
MSGRAPVRVYFLGGPGKTMRPGLCVKCAADVSALPKAARFCNRCGTRLLDHADQYPPPPLILLAYAQALFNLGRRYETAIGARRNLDEAARCYAKAARLAAPPFAALYPSP